MSGLVLLAAATTVVLWASAFIAIRGAGPSFDPGALALLRMVVGAVGLGIYAGIRGLHRPPRPAIPLIVAWGVGWFCIYNVALNMAERKLDAGTSAMIVNIAPLLVVLLAGVLLREGYPRGVVIGAPVSFAGVVLIGLNSSGSVGIGGVLLALLAAIMYAGCTLVQKRALGMVDGATFTFCGAVAGVVALLPWSGTLVDNVQHASSGAIWAVVYLGVFPTALAFSTWAYVLTRVSAGQTSATTYVTPAVALCMSWAVLGEAPTWLELVGGALCLLGVFLTRALGDGSRRKRRVAELADVDAAADEG